MDAREWRNIKSEHLVNSERFHARKPLRVAKDLDKLLVIRLVYNNLDVAFHSALS